MLNPELLKKLTEFYENESLTDTHLKNQIKFMEILSSLDPFPLTTSVLNSLKELDNIKKKQIPNNHEYYVVSLKHTSGDRICFWRPNDAGYTEILSDAGKYSKEQIEDNQSYYNNGEASIAVKVSFVDSMGRLFVENGLGNRQKLNDNRYGN